MLKSFRRLLRTYFPHSFSYTPHENPAIYQMDAMPHFHYEDSENLTRYTNIPLIHSTDIQTFVHGIDTLIFDCDGVIVKLIYFPQNQIF